MALEEVLTALVVAAEEAAAGWRAEAQQVLVGLSDLMPILYIHRGGEGVCVERGFVLRLEMSVFGEIVEGKGAGSED